MIPLHPRRPRRRHRREEEAKLAPIVLMFFALVVMTSITTGRGGLMVAVEATQALHHALVLDMMPPSSSLCGSGSGSGGGSVISSTFNYTYSPSTESDWVKHAALEGDVFLLEMGTENFTASRELVQSGNGTEEDDAAAAKQWKIRIGRGGNIYSYQNAVYGEAVPPQFLPNGAFNDDVFQTIAVNLEKNKPYDEEAYFIHESGCYLRDGLGPEDPFYSPGVSPDPISGSYDPTFALACEGNDCTVGSWGQQAHIPTVHRSHAMYFNRYRDCGSGVMEQTTVIHHSGDPTKTTFNATGQDETTFDDDELDYLNTPWRGIRRSTLRDVLLTSSVNASADAQLARPTPIWATVSTLQESAGYTVYAEGLPDESEFEMPCGAGDGGGEEVPCGDENATQLRLVLREWKGKVCGKAHSHTRTYGKSCFWCYVEDTANIASGSKGPCGLASSAPLVFRNNNTNKFVNLDLDGVIHWAWKSNLIFFVSEVNLTHPITVHKLNQRFAKGDEILVERGESVDKTYEDNVALGLVHGTGDTLSEEGPDALPAKYAKTRMYYGCVPSAPRDLNLFNTVTKFKIHPGQTYVKRQYTISDRLQDMDDRARSWVNQTHQDMYDHLETDDPAMDLPGQNVTLFLHNVTTDDAFGGCLSDEEDCDQSDADVSCVGHTTPRVNHTAHFAISCGSSAHYVGTDRYFFAPNATEPDGDRIWRPYVCDVEGVGVLEGVRPSFVLLGYFVEGSCSELSDVRYDPTLCAQQ